MSPIFDFTHVPVAYITLKARLFSMSFATPGMTSSMQNSSQEPYFSNTGQIDFKVGVRTYNQYEDTLNATNATNSAPSKNTDEKHTTSFNLSSGAKIVASITPSHSGIHTEHQDDSHDISHLTVAENAKRLARMICENENDARPTPFNAHNAHTKGGRSTTLASAMNNSSDFKKLVTEFKKNGNPDFQTWLNLNTKRQQLSVGDAQKVYADVKKLASMPKEEKVSCYSMESQMRQLRSDINALQQEQELMSQAMPANNATIKAKIGQMEKGLQKHHEKLEELSASWKKADTNLSSTKMQSMQNTKKSLKTQKSMQYTEGPMSFSTEQLRLAAAAI